MTVYRHPYRDVNFILKELVGFDSLCEALGLEDVNMELAEAVLEEAAKLGTEVIAPSNQIGDQQEPTLMEDGVHETPGFDLLHKRYAEGGWSALTVSEANGGQGLPGVLGSAVNEIWQSSNLAWSLCSMLTPGAIDVLSRYANDELKGIYIPRLASGEWTATMNLTESDAGSDLAALKTRATPDGDAYRIQGQKIFITWGDHQMTPNIVHLVLARLPDAPVGVKGISLFVVPKFLTNNKGDLGARNAVHCLSLEHKLGIHGSPTCVMEFDGATGYLVGNPHQGLACMFTMMNHARQGVGVQGVAVSERAFQLALQYAKDRVQGTRRDGSRIAIIEHPDVRRMLLTMKSLIEAMRSTALVASGQLDLAGAADDPDAMVLAELYTPVVKGWLSEMANEVTSLGLQIHGGMGYIEETGAAQFVRDVRITSIYEGTTGIQALDFIGRKTLFSRGVALSSLLAQMRGTLGDLKTSSFMDNDAISEFERAIDSGDWSLSRVLENSKSDKDFAPSVAYHFMMQFAFLIGGWMMLRSAQRATVLVKKAEGDAVFLQGKIHTAKFYCEQLLPRTQAHAAGVKAGSDSITDFEDDCFGVA